MIAVDITFYKNKDASFFPIEPLPKIPS